MWSEEGASDDVFDLELELPKPSAFKRAASPGEGRRACRELLC